MNNQRVFVVSGLIILALGLACASMLNVHVHPQTVVAAEGASALAAVLGFCLCLAGTSDTRIGFGYLPCLIVGLVVVCLAWQLRIPGLGYALYLGLLLLCYVLGGMAAETQGVAFLAAGMLGCAWLQSLAGLAQLSGWTFGGMVMQKIYLQAFGNVGQANHYADLIFIGLGALCYLFSQFPLRRWWVSTGTLVLAFWLTLAAAASASRGTLLYTGLFLVIGALACWRGRHDLRVREMGLALLSVGVLSVISQGLVTFGHILNAFDVTTAIDRAGDAGSNGQRLYNWGAALQAIKAHPWIGQGPATFYKASIDAMFTTAPASFPKFAEHAHNLLLNMGAEFGLPVSVVVLGGLGIWYLRLMLKKLTTGALLALACVGVVGLHSMVEYPLWYTYFLVPVGLCIGIADHEGGADSFLVLPRWVGGAAAVLALACLAWVGWDWAAVYKAYGALAAGEPETTMAQRLSARAELARISRFSVFTTQAEGLRLQSWHPDEGHPDRQAAQCDAHWQYKPAWFMMMRCAEAYAETERKASLDRIAVALCDGFSGYRPDLREWAANYDERRDEKQDGKELGGLPVMGRACLR